MLGAEPPLSEVESEVQRTMHAFAEKVMRPIGCKLDRAEAATLIDTGSPYWEFFSKFQELGLSVAALMELPPEVRSRLLVIANEEFGWGDAGLSIVVGGSMLPHLMSHYFGRTELIRRFPEGQPGCWAITEPNHGSDSLDPGKQLFHPEGVYGRPDCVATLKPDRVVLNGQKSAWVSNGPAAKICVLFCAADRGQGADPERGVVLLVPLDAPGVSKGKIIDKLGQRSLPQGELYFNNVELSSDHVIAGPEDYRRAVYAIHAEANVLMGAVFTGVARAAYELAYDYAHERKQGGVPIVRHQSVAQRLFHMYRKVEISRALTRRVAAYNATAVTPSLQSAMAVKVTATQNAFEVASEALQMFGGNGMTREYPIEKLLRDARLSMIEDGCNEILSIKAGFQLSDPARLRGRL